MKSSTLIIAAQLLVPQLELSAANTNFVHELHATILHLLGIDHERLTYRYGGRDFRLTDVEGHVVDEIFA